MMRTLTCLLFCLSCGVAMGQGTFSYTVSNAAGPNGLIFSQSVDLSVMSDTTVSGWSLSVCHDTAGQDVCGVATTQAVIDLNLIGPLFFQAQSIDDAATNIPGSTDGANQGIVIDQSGFFFFPDNSTLTILDVEYIALTDTGTSSTDICSTVGSPNVEAVVVCCGGASIGVGPNLTFNSGTVTYEAASDQWDFGASALDVAYDVVTGNALSNANQSVSLTIANSAANTGLTEGAGGLLEGLYDPTFVTVNSINQGAALSGLNGGSGPDQYMALDAGGAYEVIWTNTDLPMIPVLPYNPDLNVWGGEEAASLDITVDTSSLMGDLMGTSTTISVGGGVTVICGDRNLVGLSNVNSSDAVINLLPSVDLDFIRGDCNDDGIVNIADAIWTVSGYLAMPPSGAEGPCAEACDVNRDGNIDVADVTYTLAFRFMGGPQPTAPYPNCGNIADAPCDAYSNCP